MTHPSTRCARTATPAGLTTASLALVIAFLAIFSPPAARAQSGAPAADPAANAVVTPPSGTAQTAPPPAPPPEKVTPGPTPQGAVGPTSAPQEVTAFDIAVRAPPAVRELLEKHIELQRYRAVTDLDEAELNRLVAVSYTHLTLPTNREV